MYAAILLGFLVLDPGPWRGAARSLLAGCSLRPVVDAIRRCLDFYVRAGAITQASCNMLARRLQEMQDEA